MDTENPREYTVGEVAAMHGITVRTLHHWESKGLIAPAHDTLNGYRYYRDHDIETVSAILGYRAIGMPLESIRNLLADGSHSTEHLLTQRAMLEEKIGLYRRMLVTVNQLLEDAMTPSQIPLTAAQRAEIMGEALGAQYQREAEEKYAGTEEWSQYQRRTDAMSRAEWAAKKQELDETEQALTDAMARGVAPGSEEANALAERHRASLFFFDVTHAKHVLIARGYTEDARFSEHYENRAEGLAQWLRSIIEANARAYGVDPDTAQWC